LQDLNTVDYRMWGILQEKVYKHASLIWIYINEATAAMTTWSRLAHFVLSCCFSSSRSVMSILNTCSLLYSPHSVINWIQIWRILRPQLRWNNFRSFFI